MRKVTQVSWVIAAVVAAHFSGSAMADEMTPKRPNVVLADEMTPKRPNVVLADEMTPKRPNVNSLSA